MQARHVDLPERCHCPGAVARRRRFLRGATPTCVLRLVAACVLLLMLTAWPVRTIAFQGAALAPGEASVPAQHGPTTSDGQAVVRAENSATVSRRSVEFEAVRAVARAKGSVRVIVQLDVPNVKTLSAASQAAKGPGPIAAADGRLSAAIGAVRQAELVKLAGTVHTINQTYASIPFVAMTVSEAALDALERMPAVLGISEDGLLFPSLDNTVNIVGAPSVWTDGYDGSGWYVAVLDTGILATHDFFASKTIIQACFVSVNGGDCPNGTAADTTSVDAARHHPSNYSGYDHGTHVAGIAAGNDPGEPLYGVARGADIIAIQVSHRVINDAVTCAPDSDCVRYNFSDAAAGLDHVYSLRSNHLIAAVNMSFGSDANENDQAACDNGDMILKAAIDNLHGANIATVIAVGNDDRCDGIGFPACISTAVAVGATTDFDVETDFSNFQATLLDLYAPGEGIKSSVPISNSSYDSWDGTSMAAPHVAGAWAVLRQAFPSADVATILTALQATGAPVAVGDCTTTPPQRRIQIDGALDYLQLLGADCVDPPGGDVRRPIWSELAPPGGSGYPDYQNVTTNLQVLNSLRLFASIFTRAAQKLQDLTSDVEDPEADGRCVCCVGVSGACSPPEVYLNVKRKDCTAVPGLPCNGALENNSGAYPLWLPTDLFKSATTTLRFAFKYLDFLDEFRELINGPLQQIALGLSAVGSGIDNIADLFQKYADYIDEFTEGYHLGGYSTERPELHLCVGYGGHGAFAQMLNLFGEVSIGGRYTSHNLSREHRAQFRSGGFAVTAFGRAISLLPGIEADVQIDGFKLWNVNKPFGIDLGQIGQTCFPLSDIDKYDIFDLVDQGDVASFDTNNDLCLQPGEFLIRHFYEATYEVGGNPHTWPRPPFAQYDWEKDNTAVFAAGLNLPLKMTRIVKCIPTPFPCPGPGIVLFPGATLYPKLTLDAGVEWSHKAYGLRQRIQDMVNLHLPVNLRLDSGDFERPMHFLQAPDVSGDDGTSAYVQPRVAATLLFGKALGRYLTLGITVDVGISVRVEPAAYGGVHDLNVALTNTLLLSNPPVDLPCDPIVESSQTIECSNTFFVGDGTQTSGEPGDPLSTGTYTCDTTQIVTYHCKAQPEQTCTPETAADDCPAPDVCLPEYGCVAHGYCTRILDAGEDGLEGTTDDVVDVEHDTTYAACSGNAVCDEPALNEGAPCDAGADGECPAPRTCAGGENAGDACTTNADCPGGQCETPYAPCVQISPVGYFTAYQCLVHNNPAITGWQGPGCSPLTVGYASACGCASDADCVAGVETCVDGACGVGGTPVACSCDQSPCTAGRVCEEGGCLLSCTGDADCAAFQTCTAGLCVSPYGAPFAEQIVWQFTHTPKPQHAVSTYALSDILASVILDAGLWIGIDLRIFKKSYNFTLLQISDAWVLAAFNKTWYQAGLEARYQNDCDPVSGDTVTNWQPDQPSEPRVTRYNPSAAGSGYLGNARTEAELLQWCADTLPTDVADPASPTTGDIISSATDLLAWGEQIGIDVWALGGLCVTQAVDTNGDGVIDALDGPGVSKPFTQWLEDLNTNPSGLSCSYTYASQTYVFPCSALRNQMLLIWGCLDVNANPWASILASGFPSTVTTFNGHSVFDLDQMLIDPGAEFDHGNLKPQIRHYLGHVGTFWYVDVTQCFEQHHAALQLQPDDLQLVGVSMGPCCGNGALDQNGCADGPGGTPCEQCDDGNNVPGDGCSPLCRMEGPPGSFACGDGILQKGLGEQCDGAADAACPGNCQADCTCLAAPDCVPTFDGSECANIVCGVPGCVPRCVQVNPVTGEVNITDCDCRPADECHVVADITAPGLLGSPCVVPDNGSGTVTLPPAGCEYVSSDGEYTIIDGLPPGTTIEIETIHRDFVCQVPTAGVCSFLPVPASCEQPGGTLLGTEHCTNSTLAMNLVGTGALAGFVRSILLPVEFEVHSAPRTPGNPVQSFATDMHRLLGQITGDPDFDLLRVTAGTSFGLPSPGYTTLTQLSGGNWAVDSFFDITYRIDYIGAAGGALSGMSGSSTGTIHKFTGGPAACEGTCPTFTICQETRTVTAAGMIDVCCDCVPIPVGACCVSDPLVAQSCACQDLSAMECQALGGQFQGDGTTCAANGSACQVGACCQPNGSCTQTTPAACRGFVCDVDDYCPAGWLGCYGDTDCNNVVNPGDRGVISANIGQTAANLVCRFDLDGNGVINPGDRGIVSANIGLCTLLPDWQNGSGCNHGACPDLRFPQPTFQGCGTACTAATCP